MVYRIGTRKSELALTQTRWVETLLRDQKIECELVPLVSEGDTNLNQPLYQIESSGPGLFTKRLQQALLNDEIDLAVHSLKDLPTVSPPGLKVGAVTCREDSRDVLVSRSGLLKPLSKIGTSSLRREALLLSEEPSIQVVPIRGNVPTRVQKVLSQEVDGVVLAAAGLNRLKLNVNGLRVDPLPEERFVPAPGQGALGVEIRENAPAELVAALQRIEDPSSRIETTLERRILNLLEGGCTLPLGVRCRWDAKMRNAQIFAFLGVTESLVSPRVWDRFERFDISGGDVETLVDKTVRHLGQFTKRSR